MEFVPLGDSCVLIGLGDAIADAQPRVLRAVRALERARLPWAHDIVPAYTGVAVHYDAAAVLKDADDAWSAVTTALRTALEAGGDVADAEGDVFEIPVRYGGADGPDLGRVAELTRLTPDEVVDRHTAATYRVSMIGFVPGFPYLSGLDPAIAVPRLDTPRRRVPAGSVGIASEQTGIYPLETPGGWQLVGRTDAKLFIPERDPPTLLRAGDIVRFVRA